MSDVLGIQSGDLSFSSYPWSPPWSFTNSSWPSTSQECRRSLQLRETKMLPEGHSFLEVVISLCLLYREAASVMWGQWSLQVNLIGRINIWAYVDLLGGSYVSSTNHGDWVEVSCRVSSGPLLWGPGEVTAFILHGFGAWGSCRCLDRSFWAWTFGLDDVPGECFILTCPGPNLCLHCRLASAFQAAKPEA